MSLITDVSRSQLMKPITDLLITKPYGWLRFFFFIITLQPRVEWYTRL
jgi:hypothetical protein